MSTDPGAPDDVANEMSESERNRTIIFILIQVFFLAVSPVAGGFHYKLWSMLDSAILVISIGLTGLLFVLESRAMRKKLFALAVVLYVAGVIDISLNILLSGVTGWGDL
jgi:hypothetical protein